MAETRRALARAKVNLSLHLCGQRADGYHLLDSVVVFAGTGDTLTCAPADRVSLRIDGPFGKDLSAGDDNLILRAASALSAHHGRPGGAAFRLDKRLPVASGIGGGSSNAAMALRLLSDLWDCPVPEDLSLTLGADVPVCLCAPTPQRMTGIGEVLTALPAMPACWIVLVNPGIGVSTGAVFAAVEDRNRGPGPACPDRGFATFDDFAGWLRAQRNDLQAPAVSLCPQIGEVLAALSDAPLARMSGSGATCFGLYPGRNAAEAAAARIGRTSGWWVTAAPISEAETAAPLTMSA